MAEIVFTHCPFHEPGPGQYAKTLELNMLGHKWRCHECHKWGDLMPVDVEEMSELVALVPTESREM